MVATTFAALFALLASSLVGATTNAVVAAPPTKPELPPVGVKFDYQLGGPSRPAPGVEMVVRDREAPIANGIYNVCYINGFQTQPHERAFWFKRQSLLLKRNGKPVEDVDWGELLLDIRTNKKRKSLVRIMGRWIAGCKNAGFKAVEFDNLDSFLRSKKLIKKSHTKKYAMLLTKRAHHLGLAVGQKNWAEYNGKKLGFDFALVESCGRYKECSSYTKNYGRRVYAVEYRKRDLAWTCKHYGAKISVVLRDLRLKPNGVRKWC